MVDELLLGELPSVDVVFVWAKAEIAQNVTIIIGNIFGQIKINH